MVDISIICLHPFLKSTTTTTLSISQTVDSFEFPFTTTFEGIVFSEISKNSTTSILNMRDVETGLTIEMSFTGEATNPKIYNTETKEVFSLKGTYHDDDTIIINTNVGSKRVYLISNGDPVNIINQLEFGSTWFTLNIGDNIFTYTCDSGEEFLKVNFYHVNEYEGV